ncbi:MAG: hypothetical protein E7641_07165 [Ruminococcaceae bacterium]|nr:hypothetical protein [Oscillospiraceae bacterium]
MEIFPNKLFLLLVSSLILGMSGGALNDIWRICRCFAGVRYSEKGAELYKKKIPVVGSLRRIGNEGKVYRIFLGVMIFLQDIFLFCYLGAGSVVLNFYFNSAAFRSYTVAAVAVGFFIYYFTVGRLVIRVCERLVFLLRALLEIVFYILSRPFVFLFKKITVVLKKVFLKIRYSLAKKKNMCYNEEAEGEPSACADGELQK